MKHDITSFEDIKFLVDHFYAMVQRDSMIGPIFNARLKGRWELHNQKLYRFWNTVILHKPDYNGNPVPLHFTLNIDKDNFQRWLSIWDEIIDTHFEGVVAQRAKHRGRMMANAFLAKINNALNAKSI